MEDIVDDAEEEEKEIYENYEKTLMLPTSLPIQATKEEGMKISPLRVTTARLQTLLEQVEAGNTSEDLLVEIREIFNSLSSKTNFEESKQQFSEVNLRMSAIFMDSENSKISDAHILRFRQEELYLTKYCMAKYLRLLVIHSMMNYQRGLASMAYNFFYKKAGDTTTHRAAEIEISENQELANKLQQCITKNFEKRKVYSFFSR